MYIRGGVTFAACQCIGTCRYRIGDKGTALFVQSSLKFDCLQHECVGRFVSRFGRRSDASLEVCGYF
jgi:hypothetical protein